MIKFFMIKHSSIYWTILQKSLLIFYIFLNTYILTQKKSLKLTQSKSMQYEQLKLEQTANSDNHHLATTSTQDIIFITGTESPDVIQKLDKLQIKCYKALQMINHGATAEILAQKLNITLTAAKKIHLQFNKYAKIYLPRGPKPTQSTELERQNQNQEFFQSENTYSDQQGFIQLNMPSRKSGEMSLNRAIGFNTKLPNQTVQKIKKIILKVIKQDNMQSYEQMQQYLQTMNIYRSLSSIYRHVNSLKSSYPELQNRNFAMHKKDIFGGILYNIGNGRELPN